MAQLILPSGLVVELREPSFGDEIHAISVGLQDAETFTFEKFAAVVPTMTREEIANLSRSDGRILLAEVNRIWNGRPEEKEIPFENKSQSVSPVASPKTRKSSRN